MIDLLAASPIARVIGHALVEFLWQGAAIGVATWGLLLAARRATANARYLIASLGLAAMAVTPIATVVFDPAQPASISARPDSVAVVRRCGDDRSRRQCSVPGSCRRRGSNRACRSSCWRGALASRSWPSI